MIALAALGITAFTHIVVVVQENRTPDNLFYELCEKQRCSTTDPSTYDILTANWQSASGPIQPHPTPLGTNYDLCHSNVCWKNDYAGGAMNGFDANACFVGVCPPHPSYGFVSSAAGFGASVKPYLDLATQYGWANFMFQTNQGPSFPAHQYVFGGTSALTAQDDGAGNFMADNPTATGCTAPPSATVAIIDANGNEGTTAYPCANHAALPDLLEQAGVTWRYYGTEGNFGTQSLWLAPGALANYCDGYQVENCSGARWNNVDENPPDALSDIANCSLAGVSWITPEGPYSDHADMGNGGPAWVASIVNAIGQSNCADRKESHEYEGRLRSFPETDTRSCLPLARLYKASPASHVGLQAALVRAAEGSARQDLGNISSGARDHVDAKQSVSRRCRRSTSMDIGTSYWNDTAIIVTWDDWGGWYDHEPPAILAYPQGGYQLGFRVPMLFISAYTPPGTIDNDRLDFGSIIRFVESNYGITEGALGFADARATSDLAGMYNLALSPRAFRPVAAAHDGKWFVSHMCRKDCVPDDD